MSYKRSRFALKKESKTFSLNITSMTDMFTILLCFLLQTYSTNEFNIDPEQGISLPLSSVMTDPSKAVKVALTKTELKIEGRTIASLGPNGDFIAKDIETSDSNFIKPLFTELEKLTKADDGKDASIKDGKLIFEADSSLHYALLRKVMYTASMAGFPKLKLATVVGE